MKAKLLIIVTSDPRTSHRPSEAVRLAAGVGTWKKAEITLYLHGAAVLALGEWAEDLVDGDNYIRYLPIVAELGHPILVETGAAELAELGDSPISREEVTVEHLSKLAAAADNVIQF